MSSRLRIGDLILDSGRRVVLRDSTPIALGPLSYKLLVTLVEAAPNVVSHDELIEAIWSGRPVSPETLSQRVKLLRDALCDDPDHPAYIEGLRGHGYRLLARVDVMPAEAPLRDDRRVSWRIAVAIAVLAVAAIAGTAMTRQGPHERAMTAAQSPSIAVLPFADLSEARDQQYLADGVAEEILNLLSTATSLRVIASTSSFAFRDKNTDVRRIGAALRVTHVLEGSVRKSKDRIRVSLRLVSASDGNQLWSESYDRQAGDILALQTEIARSVAFELHSTLRNVTEIAARRISPEAYELYLRGQQLMRKTSYGEAARHFEQVIDMDAQFIPAYAALGVAYVMEVIDVRVGVATNREKLRGILNRAMRISPHDAGLLALSAQLAQYDGNNRIAETTYAAALQREPSNIVVRTLYPHFALDRGNPQAALRISQQSLEMDPYNASTYGMIWAIRQDLRQPREAMVAAARYLELSAPHDISGEFMTGVTSWLFAGDYAQGIRAFERSVARIEPEDAGTPAWLPLLYYNIGDVERADALMEPMHQTAWNDLERIPAQIYQYVVHGNIAAARQRAVAALKEPTIWGGADTDMIIVRLAVDAMIASGEARRAVDFIESLAPEYARYKSRDDIDPRDFSPAPIPVKSAFTSYPALYFTHYARALRATGDEIAATRMLNHVDAILSLRRQRGLFIEERYAAEVWALRGQTDAALDALEQAERDRTIYHWWQTELLHNQIFAGMRNHSRFVALVERIQSDLSKQRIDMSSLESATSTGACALPYVTVYAHPVPKPRYGGSDRMAALVDGNSLETSGWELDAGRETQPAQAVEMAERQG
jgi:TolB-like protein/DNA-binding winged helix-turn-helix (wHTH) protein